MIFESRGKQKQNKIKQKQTNKKARIISLKLIPKIGEGNGNPLQRSCLENPRDGGAWWVAVYGVAQSRTRLKRRSSGSSNLSSVEHGWNGRGLNVEVSSPGKKLYGPMQGSIG